MHLVLDLLQENFIWKFSLDVSRGLIAVESRDESTMELKFLTIELNNSNVTELRHELSWWTSLEAIEYPFIYMKDFHDESNPVSKRFLSYNLENGQINSIEVVPAQLQANSSNYYAEDSVGFKDIQRLLAVFNVEAINSVEYAEWQELVVIVYYEKEKMGLSRSILVLGKRGEILLRRRLDTDLKGVVFQSFITFDRHLLMVENRNRLLVYSAFED